MPKLALLASIPLVPIFLSAQESDNEEEIFELSPFTVDGSKDAGYYSSQTLAGGRVNSDLKNLATSVQVVTELMMEDVGATGLEDILIYTTNTDVFGTESGFTGAEDDGNGTLSSSEARQNPEDTNRVRGLGKATRTANYYPSLVPMNGYISGRVDINRGANSFLFGLGSPGGIINASLDQAEFKDFSEVKIRLSSENFEGGLGKTVSANFNRVLIEDKLALRVAAMEEDIDYLQNPAMKDTSRQFVAVKFKPFSERSILLRAHYETGEINAVPKDTLAPLESLTHWVDDPYGTNFSSPEGVDNSANRWIANAGYNLLNNPRTGTGYLGVDADGNALNGGLYGRGIKTRNYMVTWDNAIGADGLPTRAFQTGWTNGYIQRNNPLIDPDNNLNSSFSNFTRNLRVTDLGARAELEDENGVNPYYGFKQQGLLDYDVFNFRENLLTGGIDRYSNDFERYNVTLEAISDSGDFGVEFGFNKDEWNRNSYVGVARPEIAIDNNYTLPTGPNELYGEINPNFGRLYIVGLASDETRNRDTLETARMTAFAKYDFTDKFDRGPLKWLGRHTATVLYDDSFLDEQKFKFRQYIFGNDADYHLAQPIATNAQRQLSNIYYISDAFPEAFTDPNFAMSDFNVTGVPDQVNTYYPEGFSIPVTYLNTGDPDLGGRNTIRGDESFQVDSFQPEWQSASGAKLGETTTVSKALNLQSFFLNDHIVANLGWRKDTVEAYKSVKPPLVDAESGLDSDRWGMLLVDPENFNLDGIVPDKQSASNFGYGLVAKVPGEWLPDSTSLSFHYGDSSNFVPNTDKFEWNGAPVPGQSGSNTEMGFTVGLLHNKVVARVTRYEGTVENEAYAPIRVGYTRGLYNGVVRSFGRMWSDIENNDANRDGIFDLVTMEDPENPGVMIEFNPDANGNGYHDSVEPAADDTTTVWNPDDYVSLPELIEIEQFYSELVNPFLRDITNLTLVEATADSAATHSASNGFDSTLSDTVTLAAEGYEFELTFNPNKNFRLMANAAQQRSVRSDIAPRMGAIWQQLFDFYEQAPKMDRIRQNSAANLTRALLDPFNRNSLLGYLTSRGDGQDYLIARELTGMDNPAVREWRGNLVATYSFTEGRFKGAKIGGAYRYQDSAAAGYPVLTHEDGYNYADVMNPIFDDEKEFVDMWVGYKRKVFNDKVNWSVQLNIKNLFADKDPVATQFQPDGSVARVAVPAVRQFTLSNSFKF